MDEQELDSVMKSYIGLLSQKNASLETSEGQMKLNDKNCLIDISNISNLENYMQKRGYNSEKSNKLAKTYVVPLAVKLPSGEIKNIDIVVDSKGQDIAVISDNNRIKLSSRIENEILTNSIKGDVKGKVDTETIKNLLSPETLEELAEEIENDTLIPTPEEAVEKMKQKSSNVDIELTDEAKQRQSDEKEDKQDETENKLEENEENNESKKLLKNNNDIEIEEKSDIEINDKQLGEERNEAEKDDEIKQVPEEVRDEIARLCSEHNYDISALKEVMIVNPKVITEKLEETGIAENGPNVYCLRFRDAKLNDRVVMSQAGKTPVDKQAYDEPMREIMNERRYCSVDKTIEDEHDKIYFTDIHGNTTVAEMRKEPRDLTCDDKERIQKEFEELDKAADIILSSDMPIEEKAGELQKINDRRIDLFKDYGIEVPEVEGEIKADNEIHKNIENEAKADNEIHENIENEDNEHYLPEEHEFPAGPWDKR